MSLSKITISRIDPARDIPDMMDIHEKLKFDWRDPCLHLGTISVRVGDQLIGAGFLRPIVEAVMILDPDAQKSDKARALFEMMAQAITDTRDLKLAEIHAWVQDPEFCRILRRHYGFEEPCGRSLTLRLRGPNGNQRGDGAINGHPRFGDSNSR